MKVLVHVVKSIEEDRTWDEDSQRYRKEITERSTYCLGKEEAIECLEDFSTRNNVQSAWYADTKYIKL